MKKLTFDSLLRKTIYKDRNALYDLVPKEGLVGRIDERNELVMELAPILMDSSISSMFVYGTPGTGKTALTLQVMNELEREAKKRSIPLKSIYINCSENRTEHAVLTELLTQLSNTRTPKLGWSTKKVFTEIKALLNTKSINILLVLDEVDYILRESGDDVLYALSRINNHITSKVSSLVISNDLRVYDYLSPRTQSSFGRIKIIFSPYNADDLKEVLASRAKRAFMPKVVSQGVLGKIAEIEAERGGDARKALELLDACAKIALAKNRKTISMDLVNEADKNLEQDSLVKVLNALTKHQKILYLSLLKAGDESNAPAAYQMYMKECKSFKLAPLSERRVRTFIIFFSEMGLINSEVVWVRSLNKKTRKITLNLESALRNKIRKKVRDSI